MNQLVFGALLPFLVALAVYARRGCRASRRWLLLTPLAMTLGATWAVAPDIPRALRLHGLYARLAADPRTDIFLFHYTIDRIETESILFTVLFVLMTGALLAVAWREVARAEREAR
jgi:hypothetical protein